MASSHDISTNHASQSQPSARVARPQKDMHAKGSDSIATSVSTASPTDIDNDNAASPPASLAQAAAKEPDPLIALLLTWKKVYTDHGAEADQVTATPALRNSATATPSPPMTRAVGAGWHSSVVSPATSAASSELTSSSITWANWDEHFTHGKEAHNNSACLYPKTRQMLCQTTNLTRITSSRGFDRGYAPTKITTPSLTKRRYSIDVLTNDWTAKHGSMEWEKTQIEEAAPILSKHHETDVVPRQMAPKPLPLPNPFRYQSNHLQAAWIPPCDNGHYLAFQDSSIQNREFWHMSHMSGPYAWMDDSPFNMSLETLREQWECRRHSIDVVTSNVTQTMFMAYCTKELNHPSYNYLSERFLNKKWIFIPINDGLDGGYSSDAGGTHWSLVAIDRVHRYAHYYDSITPGPRITKIAIAVTDAVLGLIGSPLNGYQRVHEEHTPNQFLQNQESTDCGACGPFVWRMTSLLVQRIIHDPDCRLSITRQFYNTHWRLFNSALIRWEMQNLVVHFKTLQDSMDVAISHDVLAVEGEDVILCHRPPPVYLSPLRQRSPEPESEYTDVSDNEAMNVKDDDDDVTLDGNEDSWQVVSLKPAVTSGPAANVDPDHDTPAHDIRLDDEPNGQHSHKRSHSAREPSGDRESATEPPPRKKQSPPQRAKGNSKVRVVRRKNSVESEGWSP